MKWTPLLLIFLVGCQAPPKVTHIGRAVSMNSLGESVVFLSSPTLSIADLCITRFELIQLPPSNHFVSYGSTGYATHKYNSNDCWQANISYVSPIPCALYYKDTPQPGNVGNPTGPSIWLSWDESPDVGVVTGYAIYCGTNSGAWIVRHDAGIATATVVSNLTSTRWYFIAVAYTHEGVESPPSNEVVADLPMVTTNKSKLIFPDYIRITEQLLAGTNMINVPILKADAGFFQLRPW